MTNPNHLQTKFIVHNMTLKGIESVPGILDFDQRGVLAIEPGDSIATRRAPDQEYISYLTSLGWDFTKVTFVTPRTPKASTYKSIYEDKRILEYLKKTHVEYIDTYQSTSVEEAFAKRVGLPLLAVPKLASLYGTKSGFRTLAKKLGLAVAPGFESLRTDEDVLKAVLTLMETKAQVVIKIDESISGAGQTLLTTRDFVKLSLVKQSEIVKKAISGIPQIHDTSFVAVEEWMPQVKKSPSIQFVVIDGTISIVSMHDQLLEGNPKWYVGCSYPIDSIGVSVVEQMKEEGTLFVQELVTMGFRGYLGIDAIVTENNSLIWVEANIRKPATFYPRIIAQKLFGQAMQGVFYVACDFTVPAWIGASFATVKKTLESFLYPISNEKRGAVIYNTGALLEAGRFDLVCFGTNLEDAKHIYREIKTIITGIKPPKEVT